MNPRFSYQIWNGEQVIFRTPFFIAFIVRISDCYHLALLPYRTFVWLVDLNKSEVYSSLKYQIHFVLDSTKTTYTA